MQAHVARQVAPHAAPPAWLTNWEDNRPIWLMECELFIFILFKKNDLEVINRSVTNHFLLFLLFSCC